MNFAGAKSPRTLESVRAGLRESAWFFHWWCDRLRSAVFPAITIGQKAPVGDDIPARHRIRARPRTKQEGFEKRVLFGILLYSWALKAIDGRDTHSVQDHLLGVLRGQSVMGLEEENRRWYRLASTGLRNTTHIHAVGVQSKGSQFGAPVGVIVRSVRTGGAGFNFDDVNMIAATIIIVVLFVLTQNRLSSAVHTRLRNSSASRCHMY